jgi:flavin reductase (DIM6/NTAB) family NADH-FMN oxidoreductase RutF
MIIDPSTLSHSDVYKLMMGCIVPRPIAWVTSVSAEGIVNAAPFSAFCSVSTDPPMVGINIGRRGAGLKDTARNIAAAREYVVNIADEPLLEQLHLSAVEHPPNVSELKELGLETAPSDFVRTPRILAAPVQLECVLFRIIEFGRSTQFIVGEIKRFHVRDDLCSNNKIDTAKLRPIARVGGPTYAKLREFVSLKPVPTGPKDEMQ